MLPPNTTTFAVAYTERRSRLTTFFRWLLAIPHMIVLWFYGLFAGIAVIIAWFAIVITARYPQGLYDFVAGYHRYYGRFSGYFWLLSDPYPPFSGSEEHEYPAVLAIGPRMEKYSRLLTFFRLILMIPVWIIVYVLGIVASVLVFFAWIVIVILGRMPQGLQNVIEYCLSYTLRSGVYASLLTEAFPPFDGSPESVSGAGAGVAAAPTSGFAAGGDDDVPPPPATVDGIGDPPR